MVAAWENGSLAHGAAPLLHKDRHLLARQSRDIAAPAAKAHPPNQAGPPAASNLCNAQALTMRGPGTWPPRLQRLLPPEHVAASARRNQRLCTRLPNELTQGAEPGAEPPASHHSWHRAGGPPILLVRLQATRERRAFSAGWPTMLRPWAACRCKAVREQGLPVEWPSESQPHQKAA